MDQTEHRKLQILSQFIGSQFLRKFTKLLLSLTVFSLFFSHLSIISMLYSFNFYLHTLPIKLLSHNIDKNCIFLLFNGLLVFLAKYSSLISSSSNHNIPDGSFKGCKDVQQSEPIQVQLWENEVVVEAENGRIIEEVAERETEKFGLEEEEETKNREGDIVNSIMDGEQKEEDYDENGDFCEEDVKEIDGSYVIQEVEEEEEEEMEEENGLLSTEELNKKFDEFIRKMKEDLRIEAQQQLILV
ncbi:hypothetical protein SLA2020_304360 [Shorea laevis]